jgi:hypothetical protein
MALAKANQKVVLLAVGGVLVLCALPFRSNTVWQREQNVAAMRDGSIDAAEAKAAARTARLRSTREKE